MRKKANILITFLVLALVPTFLVRPIMVDLQNGPYHSSVQQKDKSFSLCSQEHSSKHFAFRHVDRESPNVTAFAPEVSKVKTPSLLVGRSHLVLASSGSLPKSPFVLRI